MSTDQRQTVEDAARRTADTLGSEARRAADAASERAAEQVGEASAAASEAADRLRARDQQGLGDTLDSLADGMERFAHRLRGKELDELLGDARRAARGNPALFYTAAAAAGFLGARLATARSPVRRGPAADGRDDDDGRSAPVTGQGPSATSDSPTPATTASPGPATTTPPVPGPAAGPSTDSSQGGTR